MIHKNLIIVLTKELFQDMIQLNIIKNNSYQEKQRDWPDEASATNKM